MGDKQTVLVRGENGVDMPHDLPLPDGLAQRVAKGEAQILGPCDAVGNLLDADEDANSGSGEDAENGAGDGSESGGDVSGGADVPAEPPTRRGSRANRSTAAH